MLVLDESSVYGFGRLNQYDTHGSHVGLSESLTPWPLADRSTRARGTTHYRLFASAKHPEVIETVLGEVQTKNGRTRPRIRKDIKPRWSKRMGLIARAMVLADKTLFVAGPQELLSAAPTALPSSYLSEAQAAYEGKRGALLQAISTEDGSRLAEYRLDCVPIFDGLVTAGGRLYMATTDGKVLCFSGDS